MSTMDEKQILRVARLARLDLSEQEMSEYARQLNESWPMCVKSKKWRPQTSGPRTI